MVNSVSGHNLHKQDFASHLCNYATFDGPQNNPYICLGLWEKKAQTHTHRLDEKQLWKIECHKPR